MSYKYLTVFLLWLMAAPVFAGSVPQAANFIGLGGNANLDAGITGGVKGIQCGIPFTTHTATVCFGRTEGSTLQNFVSGVVQGPQGADYIGQGTSGSFYRVSAGKTAFACGYYSLSGSAPSSNQVGFGYSTSVPASLNTSTTPTGSVFFSGTEDLYSSVNTGASNNRVYVPYKMQFPPGSFPWIQTGTAGVVYEYCADVFEVAPSP